jgi:hypothetical protein
VTFAEVTELCNPESNVIRGFEFAACLLVENSFNKPLTEGRIVSDDTLHLAKGPLQFFCPFLLFGGSLAPSATLVRMEATIDVPLHLFTATTGASRCLSGFLGGWTCEVLAGAGTREYRVVFFQI